MTAAEEGRALADADDLVVDLADAPGDTLAPGTGAGPGSLATLAPADALAAVAESFPLVLVLDAAALALALVLAVTVGFDTSLTGRGPLALAFFLVVPGWAVLRVGRVAPTSATVLAAVGLSISLTFLSGQVLIAWGWGLWRASTVLVCVVCAAVAALDIERERGRS